MALKSTIAHMTNYGPKREWTAAAGEFWGGTEMRGMRRESLLPSSCNSGRLVSIRDHNDKGEGRERMNGGAHVKWREREAPLSAILTTMCEGDWTPSRASEGMQGTHLPPRELEVSLHFKRVKTTLEV